MPAPQTEQIMLLVTQLREEVRQLADSTRSQAKYARDVIPAQNSALPSFKQRQPNASLGATDSARLKSETHVVAGVLAGMFPWMYQKPPDEKGKTKLADMQNTSIESAKKCCEAAKAAQSGAGRAPSWIGRMFKSWLTGAVLWTLLKEPLTNLWNLYKDDIKELWKKFTDIWKEWAPDWLQDWVKKTADWFKGVPKWIKTLGENIMKNVGAIFKLLAATLDGLLGGIIGALKTYVALPLVSILSAQRDEEGKPKYPWAEKIATDLANKFDPKTGTGSHTSTTLQDLITKTNLPGSDWVPGQPFPKIIPLSGPGGGKPGNREPGWLETMHTTLKELLIAWGKKKSEPTVPLVGVEGSTGAQGIPGIPGGHGPGTRGIPGIPDRLSPWTPLGGIFKGGGDRLDSPGLSPNWVAEAMSGVFSTEPSRATPSGMTAGPAPGKERWKNQQERHKVDLLTQIERNTRSSASGAGNQPIIPPGQKSSGGDPGSSPNKVASNFPSTGPPKLDSRAGLVNSPYSINANSMVT